MRRSLILALALPIALSGCAPLVVTGATQAGVAAAENRSLGRKMDDTVIYSDLTNQFMQANQTALLGSVTFNVRYARVMLTGRVKNEDEAARAVALSWKAKGVTEVINELMIDPNKSLMDTAGDIVIKRNLEARLLITKGVWVINYSIDVQSGVAYLIGRVKDQAELDRALNVARTTKGIKRVVSHLQINADTAHVVTAPDGSSPSGTSNEAPRSNSSSSANGGNMSYSNDSGGEVYTGPVYGSGSISSSPNTPAGGGY